VTGGPLTPAATWASSQSQTTDDQELRDACLAALAMARKAVEEPASSDRAPVRMTSPSSVLVYRLPHGATVVQRVAWLVDMLHSSDVAVQVRWWRRGVGCVVARTVHVDDGQQVPFLFRPTLSLRWRKPPRCLSCCRV